MHKIYSLFTTKIKYAIKLLNPHFMKHDTVFENYRIAEEEGTIIWNFGIYITSAEN